MENFIFQNPTKLVFGKGTIARLGELIPAGKRVMVTFGGGSVRRNGVYDEVCAALAGRDTVEFWGIEPNPSIETLREAIALGKEREVDFLLAVGGGSVIDGTKLIAAGLLYDGDAWELVRKGASQRTVPLGTVLTIPATGSEMNNGAVISRRETKEKYPFYGNYPLFSILDPEKTFTLPQRQVACGLADTFVHVMEQYMTVAGQSRVMDRWAEGILQTLVEIAPEIRKNQHDYDLMADFMLSATMGLNGFIAMGVAQDGATHMIGHELTALHGARVGHHDRRARRAHPAGDRTHRRILPVAGALHPSVGGGDRRGDDRRDRTAVQRAGRPLRRGPQRRRRHGAPHPRSVSLTVTTE